MKKSTKIIAAGMGLLAVFAGTAGYSILSSGNDVVRAARFSGYNKKQSVNACQAFTKIAKPGDQKIVFGKKGQPHDLCVVTAEGAHIVRMRYVENTAELIPAGQTLVY